MSGGTRLCVFQPARVLYSSSLLSFVTIDRYPNLDTTHSRARVKPLAIAFEESPFFPSRRAVSMAGLWEPLVLNGLESITELRHMSVMRENRILLRRYTHPAEFLGE